MSLLGDRGNTETAKPVRERVYNAGWQGSITSGEIQDAKDGDYDRETGARRCTFCRQARPLKTGNGTTCDAYCEKQEHGWVPWGKVHPYDKTDAGRGWLSL